MAYVSQHRNATGNVVANVFNRVTTEGDSARFNSAEVGYSRLFVWADELGGTNDLGSYKDLATRDDEGSGFDYIVGAKQLQVWVGAGSPVVWAKAVRVDDLNDLVENSLTTANFFEELGSSDVRVYASAPSVILMEVPHTSLPATTREKVIVKDQGDNEAVELLGLGDGVVMHSPSGAKWLVRIDNSGALVVESRG